MSRVEAVVHVAWELPFALGLPPQAFLVWEPAYGVALFDPRPRVGDLKWCRTSTVLPATAIFPDVGPQQEHAFPEHDYMLTARLGSGAEVPIVKLLRGQDGGFVEPRAYTYVNLFLCVDQKQKYGDASTMERAGAALNNVLDLYRFITMDPLARSIRVDKDCYYTMASVADVPEAARASSPEQIVRQIGDLSFGHVIGVNRAHSIGLNSYEDLFVGGSLPGSHLKLLVNLSREPHRLELFHQLTLSAIRRLKRSEEALSVLDAQSAFESLVAVLARETRQWKQASVAEINDQFRQGGALGTLQRRLVHLDAIAKQLAGNPGAAQFLGSQADLEWRSDLYSLRNRIIHEGLRSVSFQEAKKALVAGLHAIWTVQALHERFNRHLIWSGGALDLDHIEQTAGRLSRLFET